MKKGCDYSLWAGAFFVLLLDQLGKTLSLLAPSEQEITLNHYLSIERIYNESTIMLSHASPFGLSQIGFRAAWLCGAGILTALICWVASHCEMREKNWKTEFSKAGMFIIMGSIWGNSFDRIFRSQGVIDFVRLNCFKNSIPIMNFADVMLYVGEFGLACGIILTISEAFVKKISENANSSFKKN